MNLDAFNKKVLEVIDFHRSGVKSAPELVEYFSGKDESTSSNIFNSLRKHFFSLIKKQTQNLPQTLEAVMENCSYKKEASAFLQSEQAKQLLCPAISTCENTEAIVNAVTSILYPKIKNKSSSLPDDYYFFAILVMEIEKIGQSNFCE